MNSTKFHMKRCMVAIAGIAIGLGVCYPESPGAGGTGGYQPIVILLPPRNSKETGYRPKAPSMQHITCMYYDGTLTFEFAIPEGECQLILSDLSTGEIVAADFDSAMSEPVYVGYHSTASLTVTTANGHTSTGEW